MGWQWWERRGQARALSSTSTTAGTRAHAAVARAGSAWSCSAGALVATSSAAIMAPVR